MAPAHRSLERIETHCGPAIITVDSHTAGERTRLIVAGMPPLTGDTMAAKLEDFRSRCDHLRRLLLHEPRGDGKLLAALVTEPVSPDAAFGLLYMDGRRYPYLCGHATIGAVATFLQAGWIVAEAPETLVVVDTPSGPMPARARIVDGRVVSVAVRAVPSFVQASGQALDVPGIGPLRVETVCVGGFFVMVAADQLPVPLDVRRHGSRLVDKGMAIIAAANDQLKVAHPLRPEVRTVDVVKFYDPQAHGAGVGRGIVIYGEGQIDRSPCGTGTAAICTLLHHRGELAVGKSFASISPIDTRFTARIAAETRIGELPGVEVEIEGAAHVTGIHRFVLDPDDPLPDGFLL